MSLSLAVVIAVVAMVGPPVVHAFRRRQVDLLSAPWIAALMLVGGYVLPLPGVLDGTDGFFPSFPGRLANETGALGSALLVAALGAVGFHGGYFVLGRLGQSVRVRAPVRWNGPMLRAVSIVYVVLGCALFAGAIAIIGGPSALLASLGDRIRLTAGINYLFQAVNLLLVVAIIWWVRSLLTQTRRGPVFWMFVALALAGAALQGSKSILFIGVVWAALLWHRLGRRIPNRVILIGGVTVFVALGAYALVLREYFAVGQFVTIDPDFITPEALWFLVKRELGGNFIQLQTLSVLVDRMPADLDYQYGQTYLATLALPVPRGLWPGKPLPSTGVFTTAFWPDSWYEAGTSLPPGLMGEMYMNFHIVGVFAGMLAFGALIRRAEQAGFGENPRVVGVCLSTLLVACIPHYIRGDFAVTAIFLILFLPTWVALRLVTWGPATTRREVPEFAAMSASQGSGLSTR